MTHSKALKVILALFFALKLTVTSPAQANEPASPQGAAEFVNMLSAGVAAIWALKNEILPETEGIVLRDLIRE